jgi:hypothetical protein
VQAQILINTAFALFTGQLASLQELEPLEIHATRRFGAP